MEVSEFDVGKVEGFHDGLYYKEEEQQSHVVTLLDAGFIVYFFADVTDDKLYLTVSVHFFHYVDELFGKTVFGQNLEKKVMLNSIEGFHEV